MFDRLNPHFLHWIVTNITNKGSGVFYHMQIPTVRSSNDHEWAQLYLYHYLQDFQAHPSLVHCFLN